MGRQSECEAVGRVQQSEQRHPFGGPRTACDTDDRRERVSRSRGPGPLRPMRRRRIDPHHTPNPLVGPVSFDPRRPQQRDVTRLRKSGDDPEGGGVHPSHGINGLGGATTLLRHGLTVAALIWTARAHAQCEELVTSDALAEQAEVAEQALAAADADAYRTAHDTMVGMVPCLGRMLSTPTAAELHRTGGVRAFLDRDLERARIRFAAARLLDPDYEWPDALLPPSHPIRTAYMEESLRGRMFDVPKRPRRGVVAVDGRIGEGRLEGLPATFQLIDNNGEAELSVLLDPFDDFPTYPQAASRSVRPTTIASIAAAVGAGVLFGAAWNARQKYNDLDTPYEELDSRRAQVIGFTIGSIAFGGIAVGTGVAAVVPTGDAR